MYTSFSIENFRLFDKLTVEPLARVNLIAGDNNVGNTALLEALWLHSGPNVPELALRISAFRGIPGPNPRRLLHDIFYDFDVGRKITLSAKGDWGDAGRTLNITSRFADSSLARFPSTGSVPSPTPGAHENDFSTMSTTEIVFDYADEDGRNFVSTGRTVRSEMPPPSLLPGLPPIAGQGFFSQNATLPDRPLSVFIGARQRSGPEEDVARFGEVELAGHSDLIVNCLRQVAPNIKRLTTISAQPVTMVYADVGLSRPVPVGFLGDGVGRLLSMALAFHQARNGRILIDEVENGLHHSKLKAVWKHIHSLAQEFNVQVFATTHSYECIMAAHAAFKESELGNELAYIRLQRNRKSGQIESVAHDDKDAFDYAIDYGLEVR